MEVATRCFEGMKELLAHFGTVLLTEDQLNEVLDVLRLVMDGDALCQTAADEDGDDDEEIQEEENDFDHDSKLFGFVSDTLSELLKQYKENMGPHFDT